jgi:hypothetical protein
MAQRRFPDSAWIEAQSEVPGWAREILAAVDVERPLPPGTAEIPNGSSARLPRWKTARKVLLASWLAVLMAGPLALALVAGDQALPFVLFVMLVCGVLVGPRLVVALDPLVHHLRARWRSRGQRLFLHRNGLALVQHRGTVVVDWNDVVTTYVSPLLPGREREGLTSRLVIVLTPGRASELGAPWLILEDAFELPLDAIAADMERRRARAPAAREMETDAGQGAAPYRRDSMPVLTDSDLALARNPEHVIDAAAHGDRVPGSFVVRRPRTATAWALRGPILGAAACASATFLVGCATVGVWDKSAAGVIMLTLALILPLGGTLLCVRQALRTFRVLDQSRGVAVAFTPTKIVAPLADGLFELPWERVGALREVERRGSRGTYHALYLEGQGGGWLELPARWLSLPVSTVLAVARAYRSQRLPSAWLR